MAYNPYSDRNDPSWRNLNPDQQRIEEEKKALAEKQRAQHREDMKKERQAKEDQRAAIKRRIEEDRLERLNQNKPAAVPSTTPTPSAPSAADSEAGSTCLLQIRLSSGQQLRQQFEATDTLQTVHDFVTEKSEDAASSTFTLLQPFPRKEFTDLTMTLAAAELVPRGSITVVASAARGVVTQGEGHFPGVIAVTSKDHFDQLLQKAKPETLVVVDFSAAWCPPCQKIAPIFEKLSKKYPTYMFLKVDVDGNRDLAKHCGIRSLPTFQFYKAQVKVGSFSGASEQKLEEYIAAGGVVAAAEPEENEEMDEEEDDEDKEGDFKQQLQAMLRSGGMPPEVLKMLQDKSANLPPDVKAMLDQAVAGSSGSTPAAAPGGHRLGGGPSSSDSVPTQEEMSTAKKDEKSDKDSEGMDTA